VSQKKCRLAEKRPQPPSNPSKTQMLGVLWKVQEICHIMGAETLKIEEEMTENVEFDRSLLDIISFTWG